MVRRLMRKFLPCFLLAAGIAVGQARTAAPLAADPALEARVMDIAGELRCLVCQNETIAASHADLAVDLREQIRRRLAQGQSREQVIEFMVQRYGDFVLYRPPFKPVTWVLWLGPFVLLVAALGILARTIVRRKARIAESESGGPRALQADGARVD